MKDWLENPLGFMETRNALSLSLLATGALFVTVLQIVTARSALRILTVVLMTAVFTTAVWAAPRGRRAQGLSRRYGNAVSRRYRWPLMGVGLIGCVLFSIGWFVVSGNDTKISVAICGFVSVQAVAVALVFPLGRARRLGEEINDFHAS